MKRTEAITAWKVLEKYKDDPSLPIKVSYALYKIKLLLTPEYDFQKKKEMEILEKHNAMFLKDGSIQFKTDEERESFVEDFNNTVNELGEIEINFNDFTKPKISLNEDLHFTISDIEALEPFIEFVE